MFPYLTYGNIGRAFHLLALKLNGKGNSLRVGDWQIWPM
jgi:hypothetical protein